MKKIEDVGLDLNIKLENIIPYGKYMAKVDVDNLKINSKKKAKLILVTSINPTPAGEGKSTITIGLVDSMNSLNKKTIGCLREPSLGPVFGMKGGATGGGRSAVIPQVDINLHFTGDMHAITAANNLISACLDNHIFQGNELDINLNKIVWRRVLDINDRNLRNIEVGRGKIGVKIETRFEITVVSEIMSILCLAHDFKDLERRVKKIIVAYSNDNNAIYVDDLNIVGSVLALLKDAYNPNLVQTLDGNPMIIHGGPFANVAHGCNSLIATNLGLKLADYVITEAGFGADLGAEKFLNIKSRVGNLKVDAVVITFTIRALKMHGNVRLDQIDLPNVDAIKLGIKNLEKQIETINKFGIKPILAINKYATDTCKEIDYLVNYFTDQKVFISEMYEHGARGGIDLANEIIKKTEVQKKQKYLYNLEDKLIDKINKVCMQVYGSNKLQINQENLDKIKQLEQYKYPICVAKTASSLTDNPHLLGRPTNFNLTIKDIQVKNGAEFIVIYLGDIMTMPGLSKNPSAQAIQVENKEIKNIK